MERLEIQVVVNLSARGCATCLLPAENLNQLAAHEAAREFAFGDKLRRRGARSSKLLQSHPETAKIVYGFCGPLHLIAHGVRDVGKSLENHLSTQCGDVDAPVLDKWTIAIAPWLAGHL
jgi:hypothetical protein